MKFYYEVAPNKTVIKNSHFLTYHSNKKLQSGQIVEIPIGKKKYYRYSLEEGREAYI